MSFNQFMHPRNIYRNKVDPRQLAHVFPELSAHLIESNTKASIDYNDSEALRSLTKCLLKKDFCLDVEIPEDRLIPTLPMRLNYLLWVEDLLVHSNIKTQITGLDIGTGCCAIFPLLGVRLDSNWLFIATEIDQTNLKFATLNVVNNQLEDRIKIIENNYGTLFKDLLENLRDQKINFIVCNPPFFKEQFKTDDCEESSSRSSRFHQRKLASSCPSESVAEGGEVEFIKKIIHESFALNNRIDICTVMIGHKKSFLELKSLLKEYFVQKSILSYNYSELCQGNTKRWALAWSFSFDLTNAPRIKSCKGKPIVYYVPEEIKCCEYNMKAIAEFIKRLLVEELNIHDFSVIETKKVIEFDVKANTNTWSNQRRKRRQARNVQDSEQSCFTPKRQLEDSGDLETMSPLDDKRLRSNSDQSSAQDLCRTELILLLHCSLKIKRDKRQIYVKMNTKEMSQNKESTFQLLQYFKNNLI